MELHTRDASVIAYRNRRESHADKLLFIFVFVVGVIGILTLKTIFTQHWIGLAYASMLMCVYALLAWRTARFRVREDIIGDNLYYLGFLFTLVSLAHALWLFSTESEAAEAIVSNFGIALGTTILGVMLRVVFAQLREDPSETEREARLGLADAASRLRTELNQSVVDFNGFRAAIEQSIRDAMVEARENSTKSMQSAVEQMQQVVDKATATIAENLKGYGENTKSLNQSSTKLVQAVEGLIRRIDKIQVDDDLFTKRVEPLLVRLTLLVESVRTHADSLLKPLQELNKVAQTSADIASAAGERQAKQYARHAESISEILEKASLAGAILQQHAEHVGEQLRSGLTLLDRLQDVAKVITEMVAEQERMTSQTTELVASSKVTLNALADEGKMAISTMRNHNHELELELKRARELGIRVHVETAKMLEKIAEQLGEADRTNENPASAEAV
jgi:hypothetical protein